jgi:hypothetical protein
MAYVYRHIRLDKNEPFYIGIGSDCDYKRANDKNLRSGYWKNIVNKTDYRVDILFDDLAWEEACEKEIEFISLYGRRDLNNGTLCNMTNGGEGAFGRIVTEETRRKIGISQKGKINSEETRKKLSIANKGRKHTAETKLKISEAQKGKIISEETRIKSSKSRTGIILSPEHRAKISKALTGMKRPERSEEYRKNISKSKMGGKCYMSKKVIDKSTGKIYDCIKDAANDINVKHSTLVSYLKGRSKNKTNIEYLSV